VALLATAGVPMPSSQVNITDAGGAFVCRADFAFVEHRIAIELDGYRWHSDVAAFNKDRRVQNRLLALSWRVLRLTWWDVDLRPAAVVAEVRSMLALAQADKSGAQ
jgi:very-short-patch-repair endonuclease